MDLALSEEQVALQDSVRALLADSHPTAQVRATENDPATARAIYGALDALGLGGLLVPADFGGVGLGAAEMVVVQMELGRALVPALYTCSTVGAASALAIAGHADAAPVLSAIVEGAAKVAYAQFIRGSAHPEISLRDGGAVLDGTASFVPEGALADWLLVAARDASGQPVLCLVEYNAAGMALAPLANLTDQDMAEIAFAKTPVAYVVATGECAEQAIARADSAMKLAFAAQAIGGAEQVFAMTREYACTRKQFGQPIGSFQAIAHMLADASVNIAGSSVLVHRAAAAIDEDEPQAASWIDMAKLKACQMFRDVSAMAIQVHGGIGFTLEADPQLFFRRAKHLQLMHGEPLDLMEAVGAAVISGNHMVLENV